MKRLHDIWLDITDALFRVKRAWREWRDPWLRVPPFDAPTGPPEWLEQINEYSVVNLETGDVYTLSGRPYSHDEGWT